MHRKAKRNSGGIIIYINSRIAHLLTVCKSNTDRIWLQLKQDPGPDIYICAIYIPPHDSTSNSSLSTPWEDLQLEVTSFNNKGNVVLMGDFNARTSNLPDFNFDIDDDYSPSPSMHTNHITMPERLSMDKHVNSYGQELLSLCKMCDLTICNGRFQPDAIGELTCYTANGSSCVDYAITSNNIAASAVTSFSVGNLEDISDHCPVTLTLELESRLIDQPSLNTRLLENDLNLRNSCTSARNRDNEQSMKWEWNEVSSLSFVEILDDNELLHSLSPIESSDSVDIDDKSTD